MIVGYTPQLAVGVWVGNTDNSPMADRTFSSVNAGPIWQQFMNVAHQALPVMAFTQPPGVIERRVCVPAPRSSGSSSTSGQRCSSYRNELAVADSSSSRAPALPAAPSNQPQQEARPVRQATAPVATEIPTVTPLPTAPSQPPLTVTAVTRSAPWRAPTVVTTVPPADSPSDAQQSIPRPERSDGDRGSPGVPGQRSQGR